MPIATGFLLFPSGPIIWMAARRAPASCRSCTPLPDLPRSARPSTSPKSPFRRRGGGQSLRQRSFARRRPGLPLDTTSQTIDGISSTFADNENSPVLVYSGPLQFNLPYDNADPHCFCYTIPLTTIYDYTPAYGNLLLDIAVIVQGNDPQNSSLPVLDS